MHEMNRQAICDPSFLFSQHERTIGVSGLQMIGDKHLAESCNALGNLSSFRGLETSNLLLETAVNAFVRRSCVAAQNELV